MQNLFELVVLAGACVCGALLATLRGPIKLPILFRALVFLQLYPERELGLASLISRFKALNVASTSAEPEKCNWTRGSHRHVAGGVHDLPSGRL